ncbi:MAG: SPOR domain-containing protein [Methylophaga sp.]|nr:SPOR domain-containing protein [Methylophaga sp.]
MLQLASFSVRENADALSAQLKQMGYDPMIETISSAGTLIYRVRLQPVTDRIKLQQTAQTLSQKLKLNAQILQHNP